METITISITKDQKEALKKVLELLEEDGNFWDMCEFTAKEFKSSSIALTKLADALS